jgi:hypothetical protein
MVLAFIGGTLLFPFIHNIAQGNSHQEDSCSICQLAHTPIVKSIPEITPIIICASLESIQVLPVTPPHPDVIGSCLARGPPAA